MALTYGELVKYTNGMYKPPAGVNLNSPSVKSKTPLQMTPEQQASLLQYTGNKFNLSPQEVAAIASQYQGFQNLGSTTPYQAPGATYEELLAQSQAASQAELKKATEPLLQTIVGLENELFNTAAASKQAFEESEAARRTSMINDARARSAQNLQIQSAQPFVAKGGTFSGSNADAFKINRARRGFTPTMSDVLPAVVNI